MYLGSNGFSSPSTSAAGSSATKSSSSVDPGAVAATASEMTGQTSTSAANSADDGLLSLEPPLSSSEYNFSLDDQENLNDLFELF